MGFDKAYEILAIISRNSKVDKDDGTSSASDMAVLICPCGANSVDYMIARVMGIMECTELIASTIVLRLPVRRRGSRCDKCIAEANVEHKRKPRSSYTIACAYCDKQIASSGYKVLLNRPCCETCIKGTCRACGNVETDNCCSVTRTKALKKVTNKCDCGNDKKACYRTCYSCNKALWDNKQFLKWAKKYGKHPTR